jgi:PAS domain S-box-containing protein
MEKSPVPEAAAGLGSVDTCAGSGATDGTAPAWLAAIVDSSDDAIVSKTLDGVITSWNAAAERMFGYSAAEAVGRSITLIIPEDRLDEERDVLARVRKGKRVDHFETIRRAKDGHLVYISLTVSPVKDAAGVVIGASKTARDITERRQSEHRLATTVQRLETLYRLADELGRAKDLATVYEVAIDAIMAVGASRSSVLSFDAKGVMRFRAWRNLSDGYRAATEGHSPWAQDAETPEPIAVDDVLSDPSLSRLRDVIAAEGIRALLFIPLVHQGRLLGKFMIYYDTVHPFSESEIRLAEIIAHHVAFGLGRVRAEKAMENLLTREQQARADADAANRGKDQFLAILSHELRTPLNAILGWARMLAGSPLDDRQRAHAVDVIQRNAELQGQLIGDLLDISRIAVGKMEIERSPVDLVLVVRQATEAMAAELEAKKLRLLLEMDDAAGEILGDPRRLQQAIANLLSNAAKFSPDGGRIEVRLTRHEASARLTVTDNGVGIDRALLSQIFNPFEQADTSTTRKHRGLGLGLAIARQIVELHGGCIEAESAGLGHGATFTIDLPVLAVRVGMRSASGGMLRAPAESGSVLQGSRILVVDDQPDAADLLAFVLTRAGAEVHVAGSGTEALEVLTTQDVDVLVSDIAMPELDGYGLIREVRADPRRGGRRIRAVAVTAHMGPEVRARVLAAGFDACATKPLEAPDLIELLAKLR